MKTTLEQPASHELPRLLAMMRDFNAHEEIPWGPRIERALATLLATPSLGRVWLIRGGEGAVQGYAVLTFGFDLEYGGRDAFLTELWVAPEHRRSGVGRAALAEVLRLAREAGVHAVHLQVRPENEAARALYREVGFAESPRLLMSKTDLEPSGPLVAGRRTVSSGSPYEPTIGFSRAVRVGSRVLVSGTAPIWPDGSCDPDPEAQARRCLEIVVAALAEAGARPEHVVRTRMFLTDPKDSEAVGRAHGAVFGAVRPAATMVAVSALLDPRWRVELEAEAVVE